MTQLEISSENHAMQGDLMLKQKVEIIKTITKKEEQWVLAHN